MTVDEFERKLAIAESKLLTLQGQKDSLTAQIKTNLAAIKDAEERNDIFLKASSLLQLVSEKTREQSIGKIESIITQAIQEVYGDKSLQFKIIFENKRGTVSVEFKLWDGKLNQYLNLVRCEAGGIKNIIAAILRLVVIDLYHPKIEGPVVLDEIGVHISQEYRARFGKFLQQYSRLTGRQIILVSHLEKVNEFADKKIRLKRLETDSEVSYDDQT